MRRVRLPEAALDHVADCDAEAHQHPAEHQPAGARARAGERDQQRGRAGQGAGDEKRAGAAEPAGQARGQRGADHATQAGESDQEADQPGGQLGRADQEHHEHRLVAGEPDVARRPEDRQHPQVRVAHDEPQPGGDLPAQRRRTGGTVRPGLDGADAAQAQRGEQEAQRVQRHRCHRADDLSDQTGQTGPDEVARRLGGVQPGVGLGHLLGTQQRGQVDLVGGLEEHPGQPGAERHDQQVADGEQSEQGRHRHAREQRGAGQVGGDHHGPAADAVDPRSDRQAGEQPRQPRGRGEHRHLERGRVEHRDRHQRQRHDCHVAAHGADRVGGPEQPEVAVPEQTAARRGGALGRARGGGHHGRPGKAFAAGAGTLWAVTDGPGRRGRTRRPVPGAARRRAPAGRPTG